MTKWDIRGQNWRSSKTQQTWNHENKLAVKELVLEKLCRCFVFIWPLSAALGPRPLTSHIKCCASEIWTDRVHFQDKCYDEVIANENLLLRDSIEKFMGIVFTFWPVIGEYPNFKQSPAGAPHSFMTVMRLWCCDLPGFSAFLNVENDLCVPYTLLNL